MGLVLISELFLLCSNSCEAVYGGPDPLLLQTGHRLQVCRALLLASLTNLIFFEISRSGDFFHLDWQVLKTRNEAFASNLNFVQISHWLSSARKHPGHEIHRWAAS